MLDSSAATLAEAETPAELLSRWLPSGLISHVHLNDANQCGLGQGEDRFAPVIRALQMGRYAGWTCAARAIGYVRGIEEAL
jgi:D-psicose/D-tagatose/L-ribulose 3-epimerase